MLENNINLVRKITWKFVNKYPGLEFDDLFSEACIIYLETEHLYCPEKGAFSTFMWTVITNHLKNVIGKKANTTIKEQPTDPVTMADINEIQVLISPEAEMEEEAWNEIVQALSSEGRAIYKILTEEEHLIELSINNPKKCRGEIVNILRERGWSWPIIWRSFREIKEVLAAV